MTRSAASTARAAAARAHGMKYLTGTEISVTFAGETVHIVGLGFDPDDAAHAARAWSTTRGGREARAREMADGLAKVGIKGAYEGALKYVGNPELISRTHFARFLVETGVCTRHHEVFRRYLTEGKPGYVPHRWASLKDAVQWITQRRRHGGDRAPGALQVHRQRGVRAVHRIQGARRPRRRGRDRQPHRRRVRRSTPTRRASSAWPPRAAATSTAPSESHIDLGQLPYLPGELTPVWELLADRIQ